MMFLMCLLLSGCATGWVSAVEVDSRQPLRPGEIVAVIRGMNGVSIVGLPRRHLPEGYKYDTITVRRGNVVAVISFRTLLGRKTSDNIGIDASSPDGRALVRDLADALQRKFGKSAVRPHVEAEVNISDS